MRYILNKDANLEELLNELDKLDGVNVVIEEVEGSESCPDELSIVIKCSALRLEVERILILLEVQNEVELAVEKLYELDKLLENIELGVYDFSV